MFILIPCIFVMKKWSFLILFLCIWLSLRNQNAEPKAGVGTGTHSSSLNSTSGLKPYQRRKTFELSDSARLLKYDFYGESCPGAERTVRKAVQRLYRVRPAVAPALLRLVFHDCFIEGCDGSVLLDAADGMGSEKESFPNESLRGFDIIDNIKSEIEAVCPGVVSCSDILVLAARDAVSLAGGPFYPLLTGRRDSSNSFPDVAMNEIPSPDNDLGQTLFAFQSRGFDERETVSLLGAHSIGLIHCKFFQSRLYNHRGTNEPDPSLNLGFLRILRSRCNQSRVFSPLLPRDSRSSSWTTAFSGGEVSPTSSSKGEGNAMGYFGPGSAFGALYYRSLLNGKGILYADQQLMAGRATRQWIRAYASDATLFRRDFAHAMMKLANLQVLTAPMGQIRINCSKVV